MTKEVGFYTSLKRLIITLVHDPTWSLI